MGKKKLLSGEAVLRLKTEVFSGLSSCSSFEQIQVLEEQYKQTNSLSYKADISVFHQFTNLDTRIQQLFREKKAAYPAPVASSVVVEPSPTTVAPSVVVEPSPTTVAPSVVVDSTPITVALNSVAEATPTIETPDQEHKTREAKRAELIASLTPLIINTQKLQEQRQQELRRQQQQQFQQQYEQLEQKRQQLEQEENDKALIAERTAKISSVAPKLAALDEKYKRLLDKAGQNQEIEKYAKAAQAAKNIYDGLSALSEQYIQTGDLEQFKRESAELLDDTKNTDVKELATHRGWKEFLANLLICISVIGAIYTAFKGTFFAVPLTTKSSELVDDARQTIANIASPAA